MVLKNNIFEIRTIGKTHYIQLDKVLYCEADKAYSLIVLKDHGNIRCSKPLNTICHLLKDELFVRIHKSYLVNMRYVREHIWNRNSHVVLLSSGIQLPLARKRKTKFVEAMAKFASKRI